MGLQRGEQGRLVGVEQQAHPQAEMLRHQAGDIGGYAFEGTVPLDQFEGRIILGYHPHGQFALVPQPTPVRLVEDHRRLVDAQLAEQGQGLHAPLGESPRGEQAYKQSDANQERHGAHALGDLPIFAPAR
ncbi:hypothetical protein D3C80_1752830 [compost metagenome]